MQALPGGFLMAAEQNRLELRCPDGNPSNATIHLDAEQGTPTDWQAIATARERDLKTVGAALHEAEQQRDGAYRERARLVALVAGGLAEQAVVAPASDVDEPGWQILYAVLHGRQCAWHFSPGDADLIDFFEHVATDDPRAQWDGHTTEAKYEHVDYLARGLGTPGLFRKG